MTYHTKSTGLASVAALAVGAMIAFAPMKAEAVTLTPSVQLLSMDRIRYDINAGGGFGDLNDGLDYDLDTKINIMAFTETLFNFTVNGNGTLSIDLYVDPFAPGGVGSADVLLGSGSDAGFVPGATYKAQWGTGSEVSLTDGLEKLVSTSFAGVGPDYSQTLLFTWSNVASPKLTTASISTVPLPASALLLLGGLGGLGGLSALRRRKRAA